MKLASLINANRAQPERTKQIITEGDATTQGAIDTLEIGRLSNANIEGLLAASPDVTELEIDMANLILLHTGTKPDQPVTELIMQFVRGLNAKSAPRARPSLRQ